MQTDSTNNRLMDKNDSELGAEEQFVMCNELVRGWLEYIGTHERLMLGTQLRAIGVIGGLAMRMCELSKEEVHDATTELSNLMAEIYLTAHDHIQPAPLH